MDEQAIRKALADANGAHLCHQQLLTLIVAMLPEGRELYRQFEHVSREGIDQLRRALPDDYVAAYMGARESMLFNLNEVLSQVEQFRSEQPKQ